MIRRKNQTKRRIKQINRKRITRINRKGITRINRKECLYLSRKFKIPQDPHVNGYKLYRKRVIEIKEGVTVLVGCNGYGKSTLMQIVREGLKEEGISYINYDNEHDGGDHSRGWAGLKGDFEFLATALQSSEGENIVMNVAKLAEEMGRYAALYKNKQDEYWFLLDAIDSGLSIDNIIDIKKFLFKTVIESNPDKRVYILITANSYEMCRGERCLDVNEGKVHKFNDYEEYREFVLKCKEVKYERESKKRDKE